MPSIQITNVEPLVFDDGAPVRAASAIAQFGDGWLIAQDDQTIGAWWHNDSITPVRLFPPVQGHDSFSEDEGTKHLKPDLEVAVRVNVDRRGAVLLLGSGSLDTRMRAALVIPAGDDCEVVTAELAPLYTRVADAMGFDLEDLNLEGACVVGGDLRWFQRGHVASDIASSSIDVDLAELLEAVRSHACPDPISMRDVRRYEFESSHDVALAVTDAALLPDDRILVSVAAEDAPDAVADGEVVASALAVLSGDDVLSVQELPTAEDGSVWKVEGLAVRGASGPCLDVLAVVDQDDPHTPSVALTLDVELPG